MLGARYIRRYKGEVVQEKERKSGREIDNRTLPLHCCVCGEPTQRIAQMAAGCLGPFCAGIAPWPYAVGYYPPGFGYYPGYGYGYYGTGGRFYAHPHQEHGAHPGYGPGRRGGEYDGGCGSEGYKGGAASGGCTTSPVAPATASASDQRWSLAWILIGLFVFLILLAIVIGLIWWATSGGRGGHEGGNGCHCGSANCSGGCQK